MFKKELKYFNKWFVVGSIIDMKEQTSADGSASYGAHVSVQTGSPSGVAHLKIRNSKTNPNVYADLVNQLNIGSRIAAGFSGGWLQYSQRDYNGRTYRELTQFHIPELADHDKNNRLAGKLTGEMIDKKVQGDTLVVTLEYYPTDKDGNEVLYKGASQPQFFTLVARDKVAQELYNTPIGSNLEASVRLYNTPIYDDFGNIEDSLNEARIEKFVIHTTQPQTFMPPQVPAFGQPPQQPFGSQPQQQQTPSWNGIGGFNQQINTPTFNQPQQTSPNVFGGLPFPNVGQ